MWTFNEKTNKSSYFGTLTRLRFTNTASIWWSAILTSDSLLSTCLSSQWWLYNYYFPCLQLGVISTSPLLCSYNKIKSSVWPGFESKLTKTSYTGSLPQPSSSFVNRTYLLKGCCENKMEWLYKESLMTPGTFGSIVSFNTIKNSWKHLYKLWGRWVLLMALFFFFFFSPSPHLSLWLYRALQLESQRGYVTCLCRWDVNKSEKVETWNMCEWLGLHVLTPLCAS